MTQPTFDPLNPPNLGIGLRAGMYSSAMTCPGCGFATSDTALYECPGCNMVWRQRPQQVEVIEGPKAGESVRLVCIICQAGPEAGEMVFAGGSDLAHKACLQPEPVVAPEVDLTELPQGYLNVVTASPTPNPRRKKKKPHVHNLNERGHCGCGHQE